jgi:HK97 family phage portal protein
MSLLRRLNNSIQVKGTQPTGALTINQLPPPASFYDNARWIGNEITLYPAKDGETYINNGYNINSVVHTCINMIQKMFGKVPFYVVDINRDERKTFAEYKAIQWNLSDPRAVAEMRKMRKKSIDGIILDTQLSKFLNKPNRNQTGTAYREMLIGYKKLTGEGNQWFNRGVDRMTRQQNTAGSPFEMFIIPKYVLQLVGNGVDPWEIVKYQFQIGNGQTVEVPKENLQMWIETNYNFVSLTLDHLRGQPPLEAALLNIQALNESAVREIKESLNGGANGLLFRKDAMANQKPAPDVAAHIREQISNAVNGQDVAGAIAWLAGEWGYLPFGKTSQELQRIELNQANIDRICNVLGVPAGLLKTDQTYENARSYWKQLVYGVIAPEAYSLRDTWNGSLVEMFGMNPERQAIDCDIMALPELSQDLKEQVSAVKEANWLSKNEKRIATGYEPSPDPKHDIIPDDDMMVGGGLDEEVNLLEE